MSVGSTDAVVERLQKPLVPSLTRVVDADARARLWSTVLRLWGLPPTVQHFPGCNPVPLVASTLPLLREHRHMATLKIDGVRHLLLLTTNDGGAPVAVLIDRARTMYEVAIVANAEWFEQGTLFDGELAFHGPACDALHYLVFDVVCVKGERVAQRAFGDRLQLIHESILAVEEEEGEEDTLEAAVGEQNRIASAHATPYELTLLAKPFAPLARARDLWASREASPYRTDGLILARVDAPIVTGTARGVMLKWKEHHSVDVVLVPPPPPPAGSTKRRRGAPAAPPVWRVLVNADGGSELVPLEEAVRVRENKITASLSSTSTVVLECHVTVDDGETTLHPTRLRTDKPTPNALHTVRSTLRLCADEMRDASRFLTALDQIST